MVALAADSVGSQDTDGVALAPNAVVDLVSGLSILADSVLTIDGLYAGQVVVSAATVAGSMAALLDATDNANALKLKNDVVMVVDAGSTVSAAQLNTLSEKTSQLVDASGATKIVGTSADIATLLADSIGAGDANGVALPASLTVVASGAFANIEINSRINRLELGNVAGNQVTLGGAGQTVFGGNGGDTLVGSVGADYIDGGEGEDSLIGGSGADTLVGGAGGDVFIADELDSIVGGG
ncbi:MAG: hypothetical protein EB072_03800, partial [Betaproteobacteria bacterium]|nr:hypothetical protein [Betaproteobacteria bacterium]